MTDSNKLSPSAPSAHFEVHGTRTVLFDITKCGKCGDECRAVSSVGGTARDVPKYLALGMTEREAPEEIQLSPDDEGDGWCQDCCDAYEE